MKLTNLLVALALPIATLTGCLNVTHSDFAPAAIPQAGNIGHGEKLPIEGVDIWTVGLPDRPYVILGTGIQSSGREGLGSNSHRPKPDFRKLAELAKTYRANAVIIDGEGIATGVTPGEKPPAYTTRFQLIRYN